MIGFLSSRVGAQRCCVHEPRPVFCIFFPLRAVAADLTQTKQTWGADLSFIPFDISRSFPSSVCLSEASVSISSPASSSRSHSPYNLVLILRLQSNGYQIQSEVWTWTQSSASEPLSLNNLCWHRLCMLVPGLRLQQAPNPRNQCKVC